MAYGTRKFNAAFTTDYPKNFKTNLKGEEI